MAFLEESSFDSPLSEEDLVTLCVNSPSSAIMELHDVEKPQNHRLNGKSFELSRRDSNVEIIQNRLLPATEAQKRVEMERFITEKEGIVRHLRDQLEAEEFQLKLLKLRYKEMLREDLENTDTQDSLFTLEEVETRNNMSKSATMPLLSTPRTSSSSNTSASSSQTVRSSKSMDLSKEVKQANSKPALRSQSQSIVGELFEFLEEDFSTLFRLKK